MAMKSNVSQLLGISPTRKSSPRHRHHPYPRPVYPDCEEEDTAYVPRLDDDSLLDMIRDAERRKQGLVLAIDANDEKEGNNAEEGIEEGHNRLAVDGVLLLNFLAALFLFMGLAGFLIHGGWADDGE